MARSRTNPNASFSPEVESLDDIDLLNIYRYPEFYPAELVSRVKGSRVAQKRLEGLLRQVVRSQNSRRGSRESRQPVLAPSLPESGLPSSPQEGQMESRESAPGENSLFAQFVNFLKK